MTVVLGLAAAVGYGLSDFLGGLLSRRLPYAVVAVIGNAVAFGFTLASIQFTAPAQPTSEALLWEPRAASGALSAPSCSFVGSLAVRWASWRHSARSGPRRSRW